MIPSEKYALDTTTEVNGVTLKWTKQIKEMYEFGDSMDLSIAYTHYAYPIMNNVFKKISPWIEDQDMCIPSHGQNPSGGNNYLSGWKRSKDLDSIKSPFCGVIFTNRITNQTEGGCYVTGVNIDKSSVVEYGSFGNKRLLLDFDINKMLFSVRIWGYRVDDWDNIDYDEDPIHNQIPSLREISLKELYEHPEDYEVTTWQFSTTWVYNEQTDTWGATSIYPSLIISDGGVDNEALLGYIPFLGQTPTINFTHRENRYISITGSNNSNFPCRMNFNHVLGFAEEFELDPCKYYTYSSLLDELSSKGDDYYGTGSSWHGDIYFNYEKYTLGETILHLNSRGLSVYYNPDAPAGQLSHSVNGVLSRVTMAMDGWEACSYLASFGVYFIGDKNYNPNVNHLTPENFSNDENIMLGAMNPDGSTQGMWIVGEGIDEYNGFNKDGKTINPSYTPRIPTPPTPLFKGRRFKILLHDYSQRIILKSKRNWKE